MNNVAFFARVAEALDYEGVIERGQELAALEMWDSLGILSIIDLLEEIGIEVDIDALSKLETTDELIALAGLAVRD
jgi:acyl carrier protein